MNLFKKLFGKPDASKPNNSLNIDELLLSENLNNTIITIDNYVSELCKWGDEIEILTPEQRNFYYNQNLEREINNGGFKQYFYNSSGEFVHQTVVSLNEVGAIKTAGILQLAIDQFPDSIVPSERDKRQNILEQIEISADEKFQSLDDAFLKYEDDLNTLNINYIRKNKSQF